MENLSILKFKAMIWIIVSIIIATIIVVLAYFGAFHNVTIRTESVGGETVVYKSVLGDYRQTASVSDEVYYYLQDELKIVTYKGIGLYYDDPKKVKKEELKSDVGCVIEPEDVEKLENADCKYKIKKLPVQESAVTEFPFKGFPSVILGLIKVYPKMNRYVIGNSIAPKPSVEIYDIPNKKIIYRR